MSDEKNTTMTETGKPERETDFKNAKVGDKVWDFGLGDGTVMSVGARKLFVKFDHSDKNWLYSSSGILEGQTVRTLFWKEIKYILPSRPKRMTKKKFWFNTYNLLGKDPKSGRRSFYKNEEDADEARKGLEGFCGTFSFEIEVEE